ncbi:MAG: hypothetical protein J0M02_12135, partial [Planctomycetes bacterium]|nr:hypothetical protein [Planctomycetota bacterium]
GLSPRPADWAPLDLADLAQRLADRRDRIAIPIEQPMDGKYTVVIEGQDGKRIRNLAGGLPAAKGRIEVAWDGLDEDGRLVQPGAYRWRSIHHPGIMPEYAMSFANADEPALVPLLSNHCHFIAAGANAELAVLAAVGTEGGYAMAAFDREGRWKRGFNPILGAGWNAVGVALDDKRLYSLHDGEGWGAKIDKKKPDWQAEVGMVLIRYDLASGNVVDYPGGKRWSELERHPWGPGAKPEHLRRGMSLSGVARLGGRLYVGSRAADALLVIDCESGTEVDRIPLAKPGALASGGGRLVALSDGRPLLIDPAAKTAKPFLAPAAEKALAGLAVSAIALGEDGSFYAADGGELSQQQNFGPQGGSNAGARSHTVLRIDPAGAATTIGRPGGPYTGAWQAERMVAPSGLAILGDRLWVAEDRTGPKRAVAWDLKSGAVARQVFGNPAYGGPGAGFDPTQPTTWVGEGAWWQLDPAAKTAMPRGILGERLPAPMHWRWLRQDGRTWLLASGMLNHLDVQEADGTLRPVAAWASCHHFSYAYDWNPPAPFVAGFTAAYPEKTYVTGTHGAPNHGPMVLWVDRDGDGAMQQAEFEFSGPANLCGGSWGHDSSDLTIRLPGEVGGKAAVIALKPDGIDQRGVPRYPRLADALAAAAPAAPAAGSIRCVSSSTRSGDLVVLSEPMACYAPDGRQLWRYRNDWSNVHGSHNAPLPEPGVIQGSLFVLGMAAIDDQRDAFIINGNHGRFFALTSDGLYLDEMFNDCRVAQTRDAMLVGGECFGGVFGRADDGTYWLQTGGDGFRLYRVRGLDRLVRAEGTLQVTPAQLMAAQRRAERAQADARQTRAGRIALQPKPPTLDGNGQGWAGEPIAWSKQGRYPVKARIVRDAANLYLRWEVNDDRSPWVNNGADWTLLFKSGDSVDLQLGGDAGADPQRRGPVPGDCRLLIAPMGTNNVAVLYRHRVPGTKQGTPFASPWRTETVDEVKRLAGAKIAVRKWDAGYAVEAAVPLAELGWSPPAGRTVKADLGVIHGDDAGSINLLRNYWSNQATGLVNDVPGEIMLSPNLWGDLTVEAP